MSVGLLVSLLVLVALAAWVVTARREAARSAQRSATVELACDDEGVRRSMADGRREDVRWDEVAEVEVLTAATGPHGEAGGVIIIGDGDRRGCLVPLDRAEGAGVLQQLARLPGFDHQAFVRAVEAAPATRTTVWARAADQ